MRPLGNEWLSRKCFSLPLAVLMLVQHLARKSSAPIRMAHGGSLSGVAGIGAVASLYSHITIPPASSLQSNIWCTGVAALTALSPTLRRASILANEKKYAYHKQEYAKQGRIDNRFPKILTLGITRKLITGGEGHI